MESNIINFVGILNECASVMALGKGMCVHEQIVPNGFDSNVFVSNNLVDDMYAKCGSIKDAWRVFNMMPTCNMVTLSAIILGHVKCGQGQQTLTLYQQI
jgi:pentatricopeptide repeat protein